MKYLTDSQVTEVAQYAVNNYEFNCSWKETGRCVQDYIYDEYGFKPRSSLVGLVIRKAQLIWEGYRIAAKKLVSES